MSLIYRKLWSRSGYRQLLCVVATLPLFVGIHFLAYWLRFEGNWQSEAWGSLPQTMVWAILAKVVVFTWLGVYQGWGRYVTFHDLVVLAKAATASSICLTLVDYLVLSKLTVPRSVFLIDWALTILVVGGLLSLARLIAERQFLITLRRDKPVFIVGANDSGEALLRAIRRDNKIDYRVVAFISYDRKRLGGQIAGVPIVGMIEDTCELAESYGVADVLITAGELPGRCVRELTDAAALAKVNLHVLPSYSQLLHGRVDLRPRSVSIEDLLQRDPVQLDQDSLHQWVGDGVLMVTGSAGSIGSEICRQLLQFSPKQLILLDRSETGQFYLERELRQLDTDCDLRVCMADINDADRLEQIFREYQPETVFHAAAYKHVPLMEDNVGEAVKNIAMATRSLADLAERYSVKSFVMISTDKAVNPTSIMGTCKRVAELYVQALAKSARCRFVTVRFGNVLDSAGSVIPIFREQIQQGGPVTVTHAEMERYFMTIPEASQLVVQAGAMGSGGEIFVLDMGEPVKIYDMARDMIQLSGLQVDHDIEIQVVGIRPGEKLYEELQIDGEQHLPTGHAKIMVLDSPGCDYQLLDRQLMQLREVVHRAPEQVIALLRRIVPQYRRQDAGAAREVRRAA